MTSKRPVFLLLFSMAVAHFLTISIRAQNLEGGVHAGFASIEDASARGSETGGEFGVWVNLWTTDNWALSADWAYLCREGYSETVDGAPYQELRRNRQHVDLVLRYHFNVGRTWGLFLEAGGGALWNNRDIVNPEAIPGREESGKESTRKGVVTVGGGARVRVAPHLYWTTEAKAHNPGSSSQETLRLISGLTLSWK